MLKIKQIRCNCGRKFRDFSKFDKHHLVCKLEYTVKELNKKGVRKMAKINPEGLRKFDIDEAKAKAFWSMVRIFVLGGIAALIAWLSPVADDKVEMGVVLGILKYVEKVIREHPDTSPAVIRFLNFGQ